MPEDGERRSSGPIDWGKQIKFGISGATAGAVSRTLTAPLERIKILQQVKGIQPQLDYGGIFRSLQKITMEEGIRGHFKGNGVNCLKVIPTAAIRFTSFEGFKMLLKPADGPMPAWAKGFAGGAAGVTALMMTYPLDMVRTRLSLPNHPYHGLVHAVRLISAQEGPLAFYKGASAALISVAPFAALNFGAYEHLKELLLAWNPHPASVWLGACGAASGAFAMTVLYPLDLLKRQMMLQGAEGRPREYRNWGHAVTSTWHRFGLRGFYHGIIASYWKVVPTTSITFLTYEVMKKYLQV